MKILSEDLSLRRLARTNAARNQRPVANLIFRVCYGVGRA